MILMKLRAILASVLLLFLLVLFSSSAPLAMVVTGVLMITSYLLIRRTRQARTL